MSVIRPDSAPIPAPPVDTVARVLEESPMSITPAAYALLWSKLDRMEVKNRVVRIVCPNIVPCPRNAAVVCQLKTFSFWADSNFYKDDAVFVVGDIVFTVCRRGLLNLVGAEMGTYGDPLLVDAFGSDVEELHDEQASFGLIIRNPTLSPVLADFTPKCDYKSEEYNHESLFAHAEYLARRGDLWGWHQYLRDCIKLSRQPNMAVMNAFEKWALPSTWRENECQFSAAVAYWKGWGVITDRQKALSLLESKHGCCAESKLRLLAYMNLLGEEGKASTQDAKRLLQKANAIEEKSGEKSRDDFVLMKILEAGQWNADAHVLQVLRQLERGDFASIHTILRDLSPKQINQLGHLIRVKLRYLGLLNYEASQTAPWHAVLTIVDAKRLGFDLAQLHASTSDVGPLYNRTDEKGFPLPGEINPAFYKVPGFAAVTGLEYKKGKLRIIAIPADEHKGYLPLIFAEDITVAMTLAFGYSEPVSASLSLEGAKERWDESDYQVFRKVFNPPWLAHTLYGRSLYWADFLMKGISVVSLKDATLFTSMLPEYSQPKLIEKLDQCGGSFPTGAGRNAIVLNEIQVSWQTRDGGYEAKIGRIDHGVEGSSKRLDSDGTEDRTLFWNDPKTHPGRFAKLMTEHYSDVAKLYPPYERVRQLLVLTKLLHWARSKGWMPEERIQQQLYTFIQEKQAEAAVKKGNCMFVSIPFKPRNPAGTGGVSMHNANVVEVPWNNEPAESRYRNLEAQKDAMEILTEGWNILNKPSSGPPGTTDLFRSPSPYDVFVPEERSVPVTLESQNRSIRETNDILAHCRLVPSSWIGTPNDNFQSGPSVHMPPSDATVVDIGTVVAPILLAQTAKTTVDVGKSLWNSAKSIFGQKNK